MGSEVRRALVIGASGKTGRAVTRALVARGVAVRAAVRPGSAHDSTCRAAGADEVTAVDLGTGEGLAAAVAGVGAVYHLAPNVHPDEVEMAERVAGAAAWAGVRVFAFHSVLHPHDERMPHHLRKGEAESVIRRLVPSATTIRPAAYQDNLVGAALAGEIVVPHSLDTPFANVALADVAECAATVLCEPGHDGRAYDLLGPQVLTVREMAALATEALRRPVSARRITVSQWAAGPGAGLPASARDELVAMFEAYDADGLTGESEDLSRLLGRPGAAWADTLRAAAG